MTYTEAAWLPPNRLISGFRDTNISESLSGKRLRCDHASGPAMPAGYEPAIFQPSGALPWEASPLTTRRRSFFHVFMYYGHEKGT